MVITCRPHDWRAHDDLAAFKAALPYRRTPTKKARAAEEVFLDAFDQRKRKDKEEEGAGGAWDKDVRLVVMLPLGEAQITRFVTESGASDPARFMSELRAKDAWTFARRPLDLKELIEGWDPETGFAPRAKQHERNVVAKLRDRDDRPDNDVLSDEEARGGAQRLALALMLTDRRTLKAPNQTLSAARAEGVLDPRTILPDWTEAKRQALLRRGLFDPATYGRVRFHHRTVQEYLAACALRDLRAGGFPTKALLGMLFATSHGVDVVIPSRRPVAAWLAQWNDDVRRALIDREPELLLTLGDPESLSVATRADALRAFAASYGEGQWRGLDVPLAEVRRLSHPDLAPVIRDIWEGNATCPDVRDLMLEMIWQGELKACTDIARKAARDPNASTLQRIVAVRALVACGDEDGARDVAASLVGEPALWPNKIVAELAPSLFPRFMSAADLLTLMERTREPKSVGSGFEWHFREIAGELDPVGEDAHALREGVADLIWQKRVRDDEWYHFKGRHKHLAPGLALLCTRRWQSGSLSDTVMDALAWASVVARRAGERTIGSDDLLKALFAELTADNERRLRAFQAEVRFHVERNPDAKPDGGRLFYRADVGVRPEDLPGLLELLNQRTNSSLREAALNACLSLSYVSGSADAEVLAQIGARVRDDEKLMAEFERRTAPQEPNPKWEEMEAKRRTREGRDKRREYRVRHSWKLWRKKVLATPDWAFSDEEVRRTTRNLFRWLEARAPSRNRYDVWDHAALADVFDERIALRATDAFKQVWRAFPFIPEIRRAPEERNSMRYIWMEGLVGLTAESLEAGWTDRLSAEEASFAVDYMSAELNGFTKWAGDLVGRYGVLIEERVGADLEADWARIGRGPHLGVVQDIAYADIRIKELLAPRLLRLLQKWTPPDDIEHKRQSRHALDQALSVVAEAGGTSKQAALVGLCAERYADAPFGPLSLAWLSALFRASPNMATEAFEAALSQPLPEGAEVGPIASFASLFGRHGVAVRLSDRDEQARLLGRLLRLSYEHVRIGDDQHHEGSYSPNTRDDAQHARSMLFSALLETPGYAAWKEIQSLAPNPLFAHFADRIRLLARRRAAEDAEPAAAKPEDVQRLGAEQELPAMDDAALHRIMMDRLSDLAIEIRDDDFTDRRTLMQIGHEAEMQRTLARRLRDARRGAYTVSREEEAADAKRTDIRLTAVYGGKATIEVKIGDDRNSLSDLETALKDQLLGQYLRAEGGRSGCLLITTNGDRSVWRSQSGDVFDFDQMIARLRTEAHELGHAHDVRLSVFGLKLHEGRQTGEV